MGRLEAKRHFSAPRRASRSAGFRAVAKSVAPRLHRILSDMATVSAYEGSSGSDLTSDPVPVAPIEGRRLSEVEAGLTVIQELLAAFKNAHEKRQDVRLTVEVTPDGQAHVLSRELAPASENPVVQTDAPIAPVQASFAAARDRGARRVAEIASGADMLSAEDMAKLLGTTRMTVNTKRRKRQLLGLEGAKRGVRYPQWQIGEDGKPFAALPALFERLGGSPWAVYRFLVQRHAELGGLTGREALARGRQSEAVEAAESVAGAYS